jgi:hypothetical protein
MRSRCVGKLGRQLAWRIFFRVLALIGRMITNSWGLFAAAQKQVGSGEMFCQPPAGWCGLPGCWTTGPWRARHPGWHFIHQRWRIRSVLGTRLNPSPMLGCSAENLRTSELADADASRQSKLPLVISQVAPFLLIADSFDTRSMRTLSRARRSLCAPSPSLTAVPTFSTWASSDLMS